MHFRHDNLCYIIGVYKKNETEAGICCICMQVIQNTYEARRDKVGRVQKTVLSESIK